MKGTKPTHQGRSRKTQEAIIAALDRLLRHQAFEAITIADLAEEAGVSVGSVYRRFENKDALIPVMLDLYQQRVEARLARAAEIEAAGDAPTTLRGALHRAMVDAWSSVEEEGHLLRGAHLHSRLQPDLIGEQWTPLIEASRQSVRDLIRAFPDEIQRTDEDRMVDAVTYFLNVILIEEGLYSDHGPALLQTLKGKDFALEMAEMAYAYLTATPRIA